MDEPVVYYKPGCPFGIRLRTALIVHRVPHRSVRFRDDEVGAARVREVNNGHEISPTVHVAGHWLTNPCWRDVRDATLSPGQGVVMEGTVIDRALPARADQDGRNARLGARPAVIAVVVTAMLLTGCGSQDASPAVRLPPTRPAPPTAEAPASEAPSSEAPGSEAPARRRRDRRWKAAGGPARSPSRRRRPPSAATGSDGGSRTTERTLRSSATPC